MGWVDHIDDDKPEPHRYYDCWGPADPREFNRSAELLKLRTKGANNMTAQGEVQEVSLISKISMRTIKTLPAKFASEKGTPIAVIFGMANGIKEVMNKDSGEVYHALRGQFEAQNLDTGEIFQSGVLYLPAGIHDAIESAVGKLEAENDYISFALQIKSVTAATKAGYSYQAVNLMAAKAVDPLAELRGELENKAPKALEAPKPAKQK